MSPSIKLNFIPPSPVSDKIMLEIRGSITFPEPVDTSIDIQIFLDRVNPSYRFFSEHCILSNKTQTCVKFRFSNEGKAGKHTVIFTVSIGNEIFQVEKEIEIIESHFPSIPLIGGAWAGLYHWSEQEGRLWNAELKTFHEENWRELVRAMHECGMNTIVIQEVFRNQQYHGRHDIEKNGYQGAAFYPSKLHPKRMQIGSPESNDPIEAILSECDAHHMQVFLGVGLYAWFDFTDSALDWHKQVMRELWDIYGKHPSLYGWYISSEVQGSLQPSLVKRKFHSMKKNHDLIKQYQKEIVNFFKELRTFSDGFSPEMPIMLASNCHNLNGTEDIYRELMQYLDILCPFGFHRMPNGDLSGEEAAEFLQKICDEKKAHLWLDLEVFLFGKLRELYPRDIEGLVDDLRRFQNFEKILCYQFPGLMNAPWAKIKPGGPATEKLYQEYTEYYKKTLKI